MATRPLLPDPACLTLDRITVREGSIVFQVRATSAPAACPACGHASGRVHSHYRRTLQDLPWQGNAVRIVLVCRKYFCDNPNCKRRIFAQRIPSVAGRYARKTSRLADALQELTWHVGGAAAARIARAFGLLLSPDALLYHLKQAGIATGPTATPEVIGVDDFSFRKGIRYGTILIDLQTRTPLDLLPDRETATVEQWLKAHPGVKVVSRDRSSSFAEAIRLGAPDAVQVADRFHLLKNLMETLQQQVGKEAKAIREVLVPTEPSQVDEGPVKLTRRQERARAQSRQGRLEKWQRVHALLEQGYAKKEIARLMNLDIHTVRTYLLATTFPERQRQSPVNGPLEPYKEYLLDRWEAGCQNALQLWREVRARGFPGSATAVRDFVHPLRQPGMTPAIKRAARSAPSSRALAWLLVLGERRAPEQTQMVEKLCAACPPLAQSRQLVLDFRDLIRRRAAEELAPWLDRAKNSGLSAFATFARGIESDRAAVEAALTHEWSNGPTEGHVNRLKFIKRQGYGRAGFDLLKTRVLPQTASLAA